MLEIVVCVKAVPVQAINIGVAEGQNRVECKSMRYRMNEADEYALEEALVLKKEYGGEVSLVTVGGLTAQETLYQGLGKGADRVVRIDTNVNDSMNIARALAKALEGMKYDLILTGVESEDNLAAQVGGLLAEMLGLPFAYAVTKVEGAESGDTVQITKELGGGLTQLIEMRLPCLLCIQMGIAPLKYVPARKLLRARSKPIKSVSLTELGLTMEGGLKFIDISRPTVRSRAEIIEGNTREIAVTLIDKIKEVL